MTPTSSSGPLAALVNTGSKSSASSESSAAEGRPSLGDESAPAKDRPLFNDILQQISGFTSDGIEINTGPIPEGNRTLFATPLAQLDGTPGQNMASEAPVINWSIQGSGPSQPGLAGQVLPQADVAQPGQAQPLGQLDGDFLSQSVIINPVNLLDPAQMPLDPTLTVPVTGKSDLVTLPSGGMRPPLSGNPLPAGALQNQLTQSTIPNTTSIMGAVPGSADLLEGAGHTAALQQEPFKAAADTSMLARPVVPEFAVPFARLLKPSINAPAASATLAASAAADLASTMADGDAAQIDALRSQNIISPLDRPSSVQAPVAAIPLSRVAGAPGWDQGLGQRILWMVDNGLKQAELRLDPPHLGSVNVKITMVDDQAQLSFQAQHPAAREALESALPKLREMFNQQGLELGDADISDGGSAGDTGREAHSNEAGSRSGGNEQADSNPLQGDVPSDSRVSETRTSSSHLVDEFV